MKNLNAKSRIFLFSLLLLSLSCSKTEDINICNGSLELQVVDVFDAVENQPIGQIVVDATGGVKPYMYSIDGGSFSENNQFINLSTGSYTLMVKDANECTAVEEVFVSQQLIVSYSNEIVPILETNCMISGCHCDGNSLCFDTYENVKANALGIRDRTTARAMPPSYSGKTLTDNEITDIANWVYQGTQNN